MQIFTEVDFRKGCAFIYTTYRKYVVMEADDKEFKVSVQQQRILRLLYKFRFISVQLLAQVMGISRQGVYQGIEPLVKAKLVIKVYDKSYRIRLRPAYYYISASGVGHVRAILNVGKSVTNHLYKNDAATEEHIQHCFDVARCYVAIAKLLDPKTEIFSKSEIGRYKEFPKNRPDMYVRLPDDREAIIVVAHDIPAYIARKRYAEIITHSEDEGWDGEYPRIAFVLKTERDKKTFMFTSREKLDNMGMAEDEIFVLATTLEAVLSGDESIWFNVRRPKTPKPLFEA